jgi:hypothetical protein
MEHITCKNPLTYEEILNWRGFSFETSRQIAMSSIKSAFGLMVEVENMTYGIEESERIISNVLSKQTGY